MNIIVFLKTKGSALLHWFLRIDLRVARIIFAFVMMVVGFGSLLLMMWLLSIEITRQNLIGCAVGGVVIGGLTAVHAWWVDTRPW